MKISECEDGGIENRVVYKLDHVCMRLITSKNVNVCDTLICTQSLFSNCRQHDNDVKLVETTATVNAC